MIINMKQSLIAAIGLLLSSSLFAKDYLISTSKTSLLITANAGEPSKMQYYGVSIAPGQIQSIYDAGLVLNANSYPAFGLQTVGEKAIAITQPDGNMSLDLAVDAVTQYTSKDGEITEVLLKDKIYPVWVKQCYKAYKGTDIITTWVEIGNAGKKPVTLFQFASAYLPMFRGDNWLTHFHGAWGAEHTMDEEKLTNGQKVIANKDGLANTETDNPSFMLSLDGRPQEESGKVFGGVLAWSGNYKLKLDGDKVEDIYINKQEQGVQNFSMNIYIANREWLIDTINAAFMRGAISLERDILIPHLDTYKVMAYEHKGYVARITGLKSYFDENMKLLDDKNLEELFTGNPIYTKIRDDNPTRYIGNAKASNVMVADGCVIEGEVENSILFRGVKIAKGAKVKNCVLMQDTIVGEGTKLEYIISDKNVKITDGKELKGDEAFPVFVAKGQVV